jgi:hypothetical protein
MIVGAALFTLIVILFIYFVYLTAGIDPERQ